TTTELFWFSGRQSTQEEAPSRRGGLFAPWSDVAIFDGEATLKVTAAAHEEDKGIVKGIVNVAWGRDLHPINEFGRLAGLWPQSKWLADAIEAGEVVKCEKTALNGMDVWCLELRPSAGGGRSSRVTMWVAPSLDFSIVREEHRNVNGQVIAEVIRSDFAELSSKTDSVWFPQRIVSQNYFVHDRQWTDRPWFTTDLRFSNITRTVADDELFLDFSLDDLPAGYVVMDNRREEAYTSGPIDRYDDEMKALAADLATYVSHGNLD
ncbi:unnamed protein product, partial [marine sediment metagenome]